MENRNKLLIAGFLTLIAAGMGFAVRAGLLDVWAKQYGFTMTELGQITGGGLLGFGLVILVVGFLIDAIGYKKLMIMATICHVVSAVMLFFATPVFNSAGKDATYMILTISMFIFAVGNGICEGVINPLTSTLYPERKTHFLNLLHAGWPAGLVIGGLIVFLKGSVSWEILLATFLIPVVVYGFISFKEKFPKTASQSGSISYAGMLKNCLVPFFFVLLIAHALVGYVELGTDSWINKITGSILADPMKGTMLFIYASLVMTALRFFAGPIVHRISSLGLLFVSAVLGAIGLYLISISNGFGFMILAVTIYAVGKSFLWPTMLGVVGEQFPRSSTIAMALLGFAGMTSAGLLGGPGIGYKQDRFASQKLEEAAPETYERVKAGDENGFLFFKKITGLDGAKVGMIEDGGSKITGERDLAGDEWETEKFAGLRKQFTWWQSNEEFLETDQGPVVEAGLHGSRSAIRITAVIPAVMALIYLCLIIGFKMKGGYKEQED